jgi:hypothetical protein
VTTGRIRILFGVIRYQRQTKFTVSWLSPPSEKKIKKSFGNIKNSFIFVVVKSINNMYESVKEYHQFLRELEVKREEFLSNTKQKVKQQMDTFMSEHGWVRKGKGQKVTYTKKFNGKDVVIEFRCNYGKDYPSGLPEFVHDIRIPNSVDKIKMGYYFHWNDQDTSGVSLDVVMERMEVFYNNYTS